MEVKGTALLSLPKFVETRFGAEGLEKWLKKLEPEARAVYSKGILASSWFPLNATLCQPTRAVCDLFYGGKYAGAWEAGRFSAEFGLRGVYKFLVKLGSARFLMDRTSTILPTYYRPSRIEIEYTEPTCALFRIVEFPESSHYVEHRIAGFIEAAFEVSGASDRQVEILSSMAGGRSLTEIRARWTD